MKVNELKVVETVECIIIQTLDAVSSEDESRQLIKSLDHGGGKVGDEVGGEIKETDPVTKSILAYHIKVWILVTNRVIWRKLKTPKIFCILN